MLVPSLNLFVYFVEEDKRPYVAMNEKDKARYEREKASCAEVN